MSTEVTWSDFLRQPGQIDALLEEGDVILQRRDGESLRVSRADRVTAANEALAAAARLLAGAWKPKTTVVDVQLPWTRFLPDSDRNKFVVEFLKTFEACADLGDFGPLGRLLVEWKNTAAVHAEGLAPKLSAPIAAVGSRVRKP